MRLLWLLLTACVSCCIIHGLHAEFLEENYLEAADDDMSFLMSSLFGFRPCLDESCSDTSVQSGEYPVNEGFAPEDLPGQDYEPQHPDIMLPYQDSSVDHCLPVLASTLNEIEVIEKRHPGTKDIKLNVIGNFVRYVSRFSVLDSEDCDPTMKLLDFMHFAAATLRQDYVNLRGKECNYTLKVEDSKSEGYPDQGKDDAKRPSSSGDLSSTTSDYVSTESSTKVPCPVSSGKPNVTSPVGVTAEPCPEEEIIAEDDYQSPPYVGSLRGIPGVHYPNYSDVPITSFSCADKKYIPGFYADLETGCQVFHVCYEHRRESFLCPVGTVFNQPILACDYWYSSNCSLAPVYYDVNAKTEEATKEEEMDVAVEELINVLIESKKETVVEASHEEQTSHVEVDIMQFLPVKAKVTEYTKPEIKEQEAVSAAKPEVIEVEEIASQIFNKMVSSATNVVSKSRDIVEKDSTPELGKPFEMKLAKAKLAAAIPMAKVASVKTALPIITTAKLAAAVPVAKVVAAKAVVPIAAKAKLAAAAASIPVAKVAAVKTAVPIAVKAKLAAASASIPVAKVAAVKTALPIAAKAKLAAAAASIPVAKFAAVPIAAKTKLASAVPVKVVAKATIPKVAAKASIPMLKTKMIASALPLAKSKMVAPVFKGKALKAAGVPLTKAKVMALPLVKSKLAGPAPIVKAKLAKAAAISPLTKKALALGYMKLLKAKKLALMG